MVTPALPQCEDHQEWRESRHAEAQRRERLVETLTQAAAAPGWVRSNSLVRGGQRGLGFERRSVVIGVGHPASDAAVKSLWQKVFHVADLVQWAALDDWVVRARPAPLCAARLGPVDPDRQVSEWVQQPTTMPWGNRSILFSDPDGNLVNYFTPVTEDAIKKFKG
jgi:hypothetical protein